MSSWPLDNATAQEAVHYFPASFSQESLWLHNQLEPNQAVYNIPCCLRLRGRLNVSALEQALHALVQRHEILHTTFLVLEEQLVQVVNSTSFIALERTDLRDLPQAEQEAEALRLAAAEAQRPFDLVHGPLLRTSLLQLAAEEHMLLLTIHRIIFDDQSISVLCQELAALYIAFVEGQSFALPELPIQYADFAVWQRQWLQDEELATQLAYWRQQLSGTPALLELPTDHPRPAVQTFRGAQHRFVLSQELSDALKALSCHNEVTVFVTALAAFKVLLCRYTGQTDIVVGAPVANRNRSGTERLIGFLMNMLVLRTDLSEDPTFEEVLRRVGEVTLEAHARQNLPFEKLVQELNPERSMSHHPLFQVLFSLQSDAILAVDLPGLHLQVTEVDNETAKFDLSLTLKDTGQGLIGTWEYSTELFESTTISRMAGHFQTLLEGIVVKPELPISELPLLSAAEREQVLVVWNSTRREYPLAQCLPQLFEAQVARTPQAIAVVCEGEQLSYQELNAYANRLAHQLCEHGVGPECLVALLAERGIPFLVSMLAIFKAGGAYLPLDPHHPPARLRQVIELSQCPIVLITTAFAPTLAHALEDVTVELSPEVLSYEEMLQGSQNQENLVVSNAPHDLAYVMYTSGSTGLPKGVMVEQCGMVNHIYAKIEALSLRSHDTVAQTASQCFVISVWQFLAALLVGGNVQIYPDEVIYHPVELLTQVDHHQVSILETVPSLVRAMLDAGQIKAASRPMLEALRWLISTGEALPAELFRRWLHSYPHVPLINSYGPTECSDDVAHYPIYETPDEMRSSVPIGRVIPNMQLYVLDRHLEPLPIGVSGELYVGGIGVGRGYLGDEQRTKEAFVADPFGSENGARLYKTGDLVRYLPDGTLEFLGRIDHQVKLRGIRIELGEVEAALMKHPRVEQTVVVAREDVLGNKHLVAYIVPHQGKAVDISDLRSYVMKQLPTYMVPSAFVLLETLPLTSSGKVNRRALPVPEYNSQGLELSFAMPQTPLQETIAASWAQVLGIAQVGIHDNFFALGGHSLLVMQVLSRLRRVLQIELPLHRFFTAPTIAELSKIIEQMNASETPLTLSAPYPLPRETHRMKLSSLFSTQDSCGLQGELQRSIGISPGSPNNVSAEEDVYIFPASFFQESLWLHDRLEPDRAVYNITSYFQLRGQLNVSALEHALRALVLRHEILRTIFRMLEGQIVQVVSPTSLIALQMMDLHELPQAQQEAEVQRLVTIEAQQSFDLSYGPLLGASLIRLAAEEHMLLLTVHHIIFDEWSMSVLCQEFAALYTAFVHDLPSPLPELPIQYADFAVWQRQWFQDDMLATQLAYWQQQLSGAPVLLELPTDHPRPAVQTFQGAWYSFTLPGELVDALKALSRCKGVTLFMTLLAAFKVLLYRYTGQTDIVVGSPLANRNRSGMDELVGFFVNMLVLRTDLAGNPPFEQVLRQVSEVALEAYAHQDLPFEKLVEQLNPERSVSHHPLFQVLFTLQSDPPLTFDLPGLHLQLADVENEAAKFDLSLALKDTGQELVGTLRYRTDLFEPTTISRVAGHFQTLLESVALNPEQLISKLPLLTATERQQLLVEWNATQTVSPKDQCIHHLFERQVERTPDALAVIFEDEILTYVELNRRANQLAWYLQGLGVGPDRLVGICMPHCIEMVVGLLGVLKAGGAYVPLDPIYPAERLAFMIADAHLSVLLKLHDGQDIPASASTTIVNLQQIWPLLKRQPEQEVHSEVQAENIAYVIYTSGSTGFPKGVMIQQCGVVNYTLALCELLKVEPGWQYAMVSTLATDLGNTAIFCALASGGCVQILDYKMVTSAEAMAKWGDLHPIDVIKIVPSHLSALLAGEHGKQVLPRRRLVLGGEALQTSLLERIKELDCKCNVYNHYGPTETTIGVLVNPLGILDAAEREMGATIALGKPIANAQVYVLDHWMQEVPIGVPGELYIGGGQLARGYLSRPELTSEKFIPNPFSEEPGARLYRTGDLVRYLPDGNIEFLGRIDHQAKIRGYRIELGEIEVVLMQHPSVQEAVVVVWEGMHEDKRLVAYIVPHQGQTVGVSDLRGYVMKHLPTYMVPSAFMLLEALPLMPNGKVNRGALPKAEGLRAELETVFVAPQTEGERTIAAIWQDVLGIKKVGTQDNFFDLGGNSLLLVQVHNKLQATFKRNIALLELFEYPTVRSLVEHFTSRQSALSSPQRNLIRAESHREAMRRQQQIRQKR